MTRPALVTLAVDKLDTIVASRGDDMPNYIIRVELPEPPAADYEQLHKDMHDAGYRRVIKGRNETWWHLPHATYARRAADGEKDAIRDEVMGIAEATRRKPRVLVSETRSSSWSGLRPVTEDDPASQYD